MEMVSLMDLAKFWSALPTMLKLSIDISWPVVLWWSGIGNGTFITYYGPRLRRHFSRLQSYPHSHHTPLPATTAAHTTLQPMDTPVTPHTVIPTGIVAPHPAFTTSPTGATHATPQTTAALTPATPTTQHKDLSPEKSSNAQDPQPP